MGGGGTCTCTVFLDRELTTLSLQRHGNTDGKRRPIPLESIASVDICSDAGAEFALDSDDMCVTVVLESGQALAFSFSDEEERDTFALCLTMFVDVRRCQVSEGAEADEV